jgi:hypothetical protein
VFARPEGVAAELTMSVPGAGRCTAPCELAVDPGEYEVRFEGGGESLLSLVIVGAGERRRLVPRQLIRRLQSGGEP